MLVRLKCTWILKNFKVIYVWVAIMHIYVYMNTYLIFDQEILEWQQCHTNIIYHAIVNYRTMCFDLDPRSYLQGQGRNAQN